MLNKKSASRLVLPLVLSFCCLHSKMVSVCQGHAVIARLQYWRQIFLLQKQEKQLGVGVHLLSSLMRLSIQNLDLYPFPVRLILCTMMFKLHL